MAAVSRSYIRSHPIVFNESFWSHAHCMKLAGIELRLYASANGGRFPFHTNGYGDALLLMTNAWLSCLTGPGYTTNIFDRCRRLGTNVPESLCGRVYVQGLSETNNSEIVLLYDKRPNPGDHCHGWERLRTPFVREVCLVDGTMKVIPESRWPEFAKKSYTVIQSESYCAHGGSAHQRRIPWRAILPSA
jgi:hypothetical protein